MSASTLALEQFEGDLYKVQKNLTDISIADSPKRVPLSNRTNQKLHSPKRTIVKTTKPKIKKFFPLFSFFGGAKAPKSLIVQAQSPPVLSIKSSDKQKVFTKKREPNATKPGECLSVIEETRIFKSDPITTLSSREMESLDFLQLPTPDFDQMEEHMGDERSGQVPLTPLSSQQQNLQLPWSVISPIKKNQTKPNYLLSPSRPRTPGKGILSPKLDKPLRSFWSPCKSKSTTKPEGNNDNVYLFSGKSDVTSFTILEDDCMYDSEEYFSDDERFPTWATHITDLDLRCATKSAYDQCFTQHSIQRLNPKHLVVGYASDETQPTTAHARPFASISDFDIGRPVGAGKFGTIYVARAKVDKQLIVAIKVMHKSKMKMEHVTQLLREIKHLDLLRHRNIISLFDFFHDSQRIYLVMEYASGGDLYHSLCARKRFSEAEAAKIFYQAVLAIRVCHANDIIHRDIKPENFVWGAGHVLKLIDFGWSGPCGVVDRRTTLCGTLDYLAPEVVVSKPYGQSVDVWCLGVLLFELLTGSPPFEDEDVLTTKLNIKYVDYSLPHFLSDSVKSLLKDILRADPLSRPTIKELLSHSWLVSLVGPTSEKD